MLLCRPCARAQPGSRFDVPDVVLEGIERRFGERLTPEEAVRKVIRDVRERGDSAGETRVALQESAFDRFYYTDTAVASKVTQLFGDSKAFDESPWVGQCDLVFVDGSHALSYVLSDSRKALRLVRPGGLVLWHDYKGRRIPGVYKGLNQLARELPLVHIASTSIVAYRKPN